MWTGIQRSALRPLEAAHVVEAVLAHLRERFALLPRR